MRNKESFGEQLPTFSWMQMSLLQRVGRYLKFLQLGAVYDKTVKALKVEVDKHEKTILELKAKISTDEKL